MKRPLKTRWREKKLTVSGFYSAQKNVSLHCGEGRFTAAKGVYAAT